MKVSGEALLHGSTDDVWKTLLDPAVLVRTIPGCERLDEIGPDAYAMTVTAGVASIRGTYAGEVRLTDLVEPTSLVLHASGAGGPGTVSADVRVRLTPANAGTLVAYDADAAVGGMVGGVGQRMLAAVGRKLAGEFFAAVDGVLTGTAPELAVAAVVPAGAVVPVASQAGLRAGVSRLPGLPAMPEGRGFLAGTLVGAAIALAGVLAGALLGHRRS